MASQRWIIHVDLDAFFASVEELLDPSLRGKSVIVGGDPRGRGVVSSCSYAARAYGVRSAMPMSRAVRLCPQAVVIHGHYHQYSAYSRQVMDILRQITPQMEPVSIDEAFLDVTGCERLWGPVENIARLIQERIQTEVGLPASLGAAACKSVAKIACDYGKPHGLVIVQPGDEARFLAPLPIERLWGIGKVTGAQLRRLGISTIGELASFQGTALEHTFGKHARSLQQMARGFDPSPVMTGRERHSVSKEVTFYKDIAERTTLLRTLLLMSEQVAGLLRAHGLLGSTVRIKLRHPDFTTITRQFALDMPTDQDQVIFRYALQLFESNWKPGQKVRLVGVGVSGLVEQGGYQLNLFDHTDLRRSRLNAAVDSIRARYGEKAIQRASLLELNPRSGK